MHQYNSNSDKLLDTTLQRSNKTELFLISPSLVIFFFLCWKASWFWSNNPDLSFGWVVPILCLFLFSESWEKRPNILCQLTTFTGATFFIGAAIIFLAHIYHAAMGMTPGSFIGLPIGTMLIIISNLHYVYGGPGVKHFAMPFGFILIAIPIPSIIINPIISFLQKLVSTIDVNILNLVGIPAMRTGSLIQLPNCIVGINEACSGIRSLQSAIMATLFIGSLILKRFWSKIILLICGIFFAIVGNIFRSLFLSITAYYKGTEALEKVHDTTGWSILLFVVLGVFLISWILKKIEKIHYLEPNN